MIISLQKLLHHRLQLLVLACLCLLRTVISAQVTVSTLAGSSAGFADGTGATAQFATPTGVAVDGNGNVYVADMSNNRIRKITPDGVVTLLAGSEEGSADGTGAAAQFATPTGVAVDGTGNVYVADRENNRIRKITPDGVVSTLAGSGTYGFADGTGTAAQFKRPFGVAVDGNGNVYVADTENNRIRKVTPAGMVTTFAGSWAEGFADGTGTAAQFSFPQGVAVDGNGNVYVADMNNNRIRKITPDGVVSTLAGSSYGYAEGTGTAAQFAWPHGVAVDGNGNVYVADRENNRIRKITPDGVVSTLAGSGTNGFADGTGTAAQFEWPFGIAVDGSGIIYVADRNNNRIRKLTISPTARNSASTLTFALFPNPASSGFTVQATQAGSYSLRVENTQGQVVQQATFVGTQHQVNAATLPAGIYTVHLQSPQGSGVQRVVVQ